MHCALKNVFYFISCNMVKSQPIFTIFSLSFKATVNTFSSVKKTKSKANLEKFLRTSLRAVQLACQLLRTSPVDALQLHTWCWTTLFPQPTISFPVFRLVPKCTCCTATPQWGVKPMTLWSQGRCPTRCAMVHTGTYRAIWNNLTGAMDTNWMSVADSRHVLTWSSVLHRQHSLIDQLTSDLTRKHDTADVCLHWLLTRKHDTADVCLHWLLARKHNKADVWTLCLLDLQPVSTCAS